VNHELISDMHNGVGVKGMVSKRTHSDINVEIPHPYSGLNNGNHPWQATEIDVGQLQ
jgi:hypothetical protein